ncbi:MAG: hypothetical protein QOJ62_475 [Actinomycetota bacterium]|nr:hypothetical protein [Actinomycetota bacterium]
MTDWATISSLATAGGTLVLALATFASVRSANRAARTAERSLLEGLRPLLVPSRLQDPPEKISFVDQHWVHVAGGHAAVEVTDEVIYLAAALRNAGRGMAVLHGWFAMRGAGTAAGSDHVPPDEFRRLTRDLYIAPGDHGFWQGALRDPAEPIFAGLRDSVQAAEPITIELLYGDQVGGQRAITRFVLLPHDDPDGQRSWLATVSRQWHLDRAAPR